MTNGSFIPPSLPIRERERDVYLDREWAESDVIVLSSQTECRRRAAVSIKERWSVCVCEAKKQTELREDKMK